MEGEDIRLDFPVEWYPQRFTLLAIPPPGRLVTIDRGNTIEEIRLQIFSFGAGGLLHVTVREKMMVGEFAMTMAKIGYCFAVAERGLDFFDGDDIRDLLRGKRDDVFNFVGSSNSNEKLGRHHLHGLYMRHRNGFLTVLVHLFASVCVGPNSPIPYEVVVGKIR